ncbi:MAG TPA: D-arabinono-1,4-lactone oxidase, partial [Terriglobales bacterium]|nr:D-arabinono-1,4-lactone oxidase [Terriglobales bacterium]
MDKRTFLKMCSAAVGSQLLSPRPVWPAEGKLTNWAGNVEYSTEKQHAANALTDAQAFVKNRKSLKVLGTRHCFNTIADTTSEFLSLRPMNQVVEMNVAARTVTIESGMSYGQLCPILDGQGWALHNLASLPHISVAGACTTATHGSGEKNGNLATAVAALEFINAAGDVVKLSRSQDGEAFHGAVVGLGALGVITKLTLDIQPRFTMKQYVYENLAFREVKENFDAIESAGYSVSLFTDWQNTINEVWIKLRIDDKPEFEAPPDFFGAKRASKNLHPIVALSAENCTEQLGVPGPWYERLPHFRMGFTPSAGKELQSEYFVPRQNAVDAIFAVQRLHAQITPHLLISEIRTIASDELWLSPCYKQPSVAIHFTWKQDWPAVRALLPLIEKELSPFHVRPHWGKLFTVSPADLRARYPRLPDFVELCGKYDPSGKFRNNFLNTNVFAGKRASA